MTYQDRRYIRHEAVSSYTSHATSNVSFDSKFAQPYWQIDSICRDLLHFRHMNLASKENRLVIMPLTLSTCLYRESYGIIARSYASYKWPNSVISKSTRPSSLNFVGSQTVWTIMSSYEEILRQAPITRRISPVSNDRVMVWVSDFMKSFILDLQSMLSRLIIEGLSSLEES